MAWSMNAYVCTNLDNQRERYGSIKFELVLKIALNMNRFEKFFMDGKHGLNISID